MNRQSQQQQEPDQKKSAFDEGLMDNSHNQQGTPKTGKQPLDKNPPGKSNPEIDIPFNSPEKTEKKIPDIKKNTDEDSQVD